MASSQRGSLLCPFPVLFYWALWKTDGSCIVSKCPSLGNLLGCLSRTFCLCHLLSSPRITHPPRYPPWPSLEEALHSPSLGSRKGPAWLHTADSRLLLFLLGIQKASLFPEVRPPARPRPLSFLGTLLCLVLGRSYTVTGAFNTSLQVLTAQVQGPSPPRLSPCYQRKLLCCQTAALLPPLILPVLLLARPQPTHSVGDAPTQPLDSPLFFPSSPYSPLSLEVHFDPHQS